MGADNCSPPSNTERFVTEFRYDPLSEQYGKPVIVIKLGRVFDDGFVDVRFNGFVREIDQSPLRLDIFSIIKIDEHEMLAADEHILPTGYDVSDKGKTLTVFFNPLAPSGSLSDRILCQVLAAAMERLVNRIESYCAEVKSTYQIDRFSQTLLPL